MGNERDLYNRAQFKLLLTLIASVTLFEAQRCGLLSETKAAGQERGNANGVRFNNAIQLACRAKIFTCLIQHLRWMAWHFRRVGVRAAPAAGFI